MPIRSFEKHFPKPYSQHTVVTDSSYSEYRRRKLEDGVHHFCKTVKRSPVPIDNSWIVSYNPFLCLKYDSHINVEAVYSVMAVKYLYKYITKGSDRVMLQLAHYWPRCSQGKWQNFLTVDPPSSSKNQQEGCPGHSPKWHCSDPVAQWEDTA